MAVELRIIFFGLLLLACTACARGGYFLKACTFPDEAVYVDDDWVAAVSTATAEYFIPIIQLSYTRVEVIMKHSNKQFDPINRKVWKSDVTVDCGFDSETSAAVVIFDESGRLIEQINLKLD